MSLPSQETSPKPLVAPTSEQQKVLQRIATQRERLRARRAAYLKAQALQAANPGEGGGAATGPWVARGLALARQHPGAAVVGAIGLAMAAGPRRVVRWAGILLPLLAQLRR